MDSEATLTSLHDALRDQDREAACTALMDLYHWLRMGGFMPKDPRGSAGPDASPVPLTAKARLLR